MNERYQLEPIGSVCTADGKTLICLEEPFRKGLIALDGFSHLQILWWAHQTDSAEHRSRLVQQKLFKSGPDRLGIFATRAPARPNPVMLSIIQVEDIDPQEGLILTSFLDAQDGTPVLDIKPYFAMERVRGCQTPAWCQHWPQWYEDRLAFDWRQEMVDFG